jgi:hypothetical protein
VDCRRAVEQGDAALRQDAVGAQLRLYGRTL